MTSYTTKIYSRKYLKCQHSKYTEFQWLSDANIQSRSSVVTLSEVGALGVVVYLIGLETTLGKNPNVKYKVVLGQGCFLLLGKIIVIDKSI
ncbi:hypothetical protein GIB67_029379 [Kingdonia uniflora]|uniref:Uncharacterized protein n=1 Tax=Kingdonia uniflora TaxID=39325 RepID=A0A7J7NXM9_9MAGN|nr:hypothetical protein GIB67_029379 [Kingdonia uniflora]